MKSIGGITREFFSKLLPSLGREEKELEGVGGGGVMLADALSAVFTHP